MINKLIREAARDSKHSSLQGLEKEAAQMVEWEVAQNAAYKLVQMLTDANSYVNRNDNKLNMYSPIAWVRLCGTISTLTAGMMCVRMTIEGKTNREIETATGLCSGSIASYRGWNTVYAYRVEQMLAEKGKNPEQRSRALQSLFSTGVTL
jgi:uncharacterized protein YerC